MADDDEQSDHGRNGRHRRSNQPIVPHAYSSFNPGQFNGNGSRDAIDYIQHYERIASALNFTPEQYHHVFSLNLTGTASYWFTDICDIANAQSPPIPITWDYIKRSFISTFAMAGQSKDQALEHQLANRKLQPNEAPLVYVYDMLALIKRLTLEPPEERKMALIIGGLTPNYRAPLILQQPTNLKDLQTKLQLIQHSLAMNPETPTALPSNTLSDSSSTITAMQSQIDALKELYLTTGVKKKAAKVNAIDTDATSYHKAHQKSSKHKVSFKHPPPETSESEGEETDGSGYSSSHSATKDYQKKKHSGKNNRSSRKDKHEQGSPKEHHKKQSDSPSPARKFVNKVLAYLPDNRPTYSHSQSSAQKPSLTSDHSLKREVVDQKARADHLETQLNQMRQQLTALLSLQPTNKPRSRSSSPGNQGCYTCGDFSHFANQCPKKKSKPSTNVCTHATSSKMRPARTHDELFGELPPFTTPDTPDAIVTARNKGNQLLINVFYNGRDIKALIDTGSAITIMATEEVGHVAPLFNGGLEISSANDSLMRTDGSTLLDFAINGTFYRHPVALIDGFKYPLLLGLDFLKRFLIVNFNFATNALVLIAHPTKSEYDQEWESSDDDEPDQTEPPVQKVYKPAYRTGIKRQFNSRKAQTTIACGMLSVPAL
ncbi:MAG TPA: retropepsin-like aspartic protease, partial [Ferruginibacter sp.]|nr:retropepsin-like aspartic protease [Ferruginibacter sp.]